MRLIVTESIEKAAKTIGISFEDIYAYIKSHRKNGLEELYSPLSDTVAYKGYITRLQRIIIFSVQSSGIVYPVYIGDKHDNIAKNLTVTLIRKEAEQRQIAVEKDVLAKKNKNQTFLICFFCNFYYTLYSKFIFSAFL